MCAERGGFSCEAVKKKRSSPKKARTSNVAPLVASPAESSAGNTLPSPACNDTAPPVKIATSHYNAINEKSRKIRMNDLFNVVTSTESAQTYKSLELENRLTNFVKSDVLLTVQYLLSLIIVAQYIFERNFPQQILTKIRTNTLFFVIVNRFIDITCRMNNIFSSANNLDTIGKSTKKISHAYESIQLKDKDAVARSAREEIKTLIGSSESQNIIFSVMTMLFSQTSFSLASLVIYDILFVVKYTILGYMAIDSSKMVELPVTLTNALFSAGVKVQQPISSECVVDALSIAIELGVLASLLMSDRGKSSPMFLLFYALVTQYLIERLRGFLRGSGRDILKMFNGPEKTISRKAKRK